MKPGRSIHPATSAIAGWFGLAVVASGCWRFFSAAGGHAGLWFGIVMGGLALTGSLLFRLNRSRSGNLLIWLSILFVGGWFCYESFVKKGLADAEIRQLIVIALTAVVALALLVLNQRTERKNSTGTSTGTGFANEPVE